jgi:hypothetical protein
MAGNDVLLTWHDRMFSWRLNAAVTEVTGDARVISARQQSSARYFQRPDRGAGSGGFFSNRFDPAATSLRGGGLYTRIAKETGNTFGELQFNTRTPGYETNDFAFQPRADYLWYNGNVGYIWTKPTNWYRQIIVIGGAEAQRDYSGVWTEKEVHEYASIQTPQFWNIAAFHIGQVPVFDDRALRGGPVVGAPGYNFYSANVSTDSRHAWVGSAGLRYFRDEPGGGGPTISMSAQYRPASSVSLSFGPSLSRSRSRAQYVTAIADPTATSFYGTRYVMSRLDQRTLALDTRASVTFSPRMTLELYAQPFFAAGRYANFEEYAAPRSRNLLVYGRDRGTVTPATDPTTGMVTTYTIDPDGVGPASSFTLKNPDFSQQSLRGNAVFRWEYRPGSVLYVAWTQSRFAQSKFGDLDFGRDRGLLADTRPDNIFLVKASYWLPR